MRIYKKNKKQLIFECGAKCHGESWIRFEICDDGDGKELEIDKAAMCCDIILSQRNIDTLVDWLSASKLTSINYIRR
jgi:hypothetical protein